MTTAPDPSAPRTAAPDPSAPRTAAPDPSPPRTTVDVVIPTVGRPSLARLLDALGRCDGPRPGRVLVADDRPDATTPLAIGDVAPWLAERLSVLRGRAEGPAAARNLGWRASNAEWIAFLDDDVLPEPDWLAALDRDLAAAGGEVGGVQGRITVPLPTDRPPTDWERNVAGLATAQWATADLAYRRAALLAVGGFDERFPRAYREDADLGLRVTERGWRIAVGQRRVTHPVGPAAARVSVRLQRGNADDVLMRALHGRRWRGHAGVPRGRRRRHLATTAAGALAITGAALLAALTGRRPSNRQDLLPLVGLTPASRQRSAANPSNWQRLVPLMGLSPASRAQPIAFLGFAAWAAGTGELAWARIAPGPRTAAEVRTMLATSAVLPAAATWHWLRGWTKLPRKLADRDRAPGPRPPDAAPPPAAVLLDRDGTLVVDVPYNGDPAKVEPVAGVPEALDRLRAAGVRLAVISNQSGVGRGLITAEQVAAVNARVEELLGPFDGWFVCLHGPDDGCGCRKPAPGLVHQATEALGVPARHCAVVGDIGADVEAAAAAGARGILVPTPVTRDEEVRAAREVAPDLGTAVDRLLGARPTAAAPLRVPVPEGRR